MAPPKHFSFFPLLPLFASINKERRLASAAQGMPIRKIFEEIVSYGLP
jgi:hypothetical protein